MFRLVAVDSNSEAQELCRELAGRFGWTFFDDGFYREVARKGKVPGDRARRCSQQLDSRAYSLLRCFWPGSVERGGHFDEDKAFDCERAFELASEVTTELADRGGCVLAHPGACSMLVHRSDTFRVLVFASRQERIRWAGAVTKSRRDALRIVDHEESARNRFYKHHFGRVWPCWQDYHMVIDRCLGQAAIAEAVLRAVSFSVRTIA